MAWGLSAGERGAATAGLGSGQGVQSVLLRWDRGAGERQQGERREAQPPGDEEEGGGLAEGPMEKRLVCLDVRNSDDPSTKSMGGSSGFLWKNTRNTNGFRDYITQGTTATVGSQTLCISTLFPVS